jgi:catechol 2,3-dioxygenase-like lactoylglutathione lyase family enzyme
MEVAFMSQRLGLTALLVRDYDEAIAFYVGKLGFELCEDTRLSADKRWVVVAPPGGGAGLLLARAANDRQIAAIGEQSGGRVFLFLETDDFVRDHAAYVERGVSFVEPPRREAYGTVAVFEDLYGNRWDLIEHARGPGKDFP